jgi:thioredoxin reductase
MSISYTASLEKNIEELQEQLACTERLLEVYKKVTFSFVCKVHNNKVKDISFMMGHEAALDDSLYLASLAKSNRKWVFSTDAFGQVEKDIKDNQPVQYYIEKILDIMHMTGITYKVEILR